MTISELVDNAARLGFRLAEQPSAGGGQLWRSGVGPYQDGYTFKWPEGGALDYEMSDEPYRLVRLYDEARVILTYCEGDLDLEVYPDAPSYFAGVASARDFYAR